MGDVVPDPAGLGVGSSMTRKPRSSGRLYSASVAPTLSIASTAACRSSTIHSKCICFGVSPAGQVGGL